jgi:hypothetical protein
MLFCGYCLSAKNSLVLSHLRFCRRTGIGLKFLSQASSLCACVCIHEGDMCEILWTLPFTLFSKAFFLLNVKGSTVNHPLFLLITVTVSPGLNAFEPDLFMSSSIKLKQKQTYSSHRSWSNQVYWTDTCCNWCLVCRRSYCSCKTNSHSMKCNCEFLPMVQPFEWCFWCHLDYRTSLALQSHS